MKTDVITISSEGNNMEAALDQIEKIAAYSVEASNMIKKIKEAVKSNYEKFEMTATLIGNTLSIGLSKALGELENPTYSLSFTQGRATTVLSSGVLSTTQIELQQTPTVGTKYKLTVSCDNYLRS